MVALILVLEEHCVDSYVGLECLGCSSISSIAFVVCVLDSCHSDWSEMESQSNFSLNFHWTND